MLVKINGKDSYIPKDSTVQDLIRVKNLPEKLIIVDLNGTILNAELWSKTYVRPDDYLQFIQIVGGG